MNQQLLVFVGMPGAGKSLAVEYLKQKVLPTVYFGGITLDEIKQRNLEVNENNEKLVREDIRAKEGKGAYAKRIIAQIEAEADKGHELIIVDGLYSWSEYKIFQQRFGTAATVVAIAAPRALRHQRLLTRPVRPLSEEEITAREYAEIENLEKGGPIANADYTIINDATKAKLEQALNNIVELIQENSAAK